MGIAAMIKIGLVALVLAGGGYAVYRITSDAYNRGVQARDRAAAVKIAKDKRAVVDDAEAHAGMTPDQLDEELKRKCREAGGTELQCR